MIKVNKNFIKILILLAFALIAAACPGKSSQQQSGGGILSFDETADAANIVKESNDILKQIKQKFKENEPRLEELQNALKEKNPEKVRAIADQLVTEINAGTEAAGEAITKLRTAKDKNINDDYREYLDLKILALEKYVEAFEERRQVAIFLRDKYDPKNDAQRKMFKDEYDRREEKFKQIMQEARQLSEQANNLARESLNRKS